MNRDTLVLYCWREISTFQVKELQSLTHLPNTTEVSFKHASDGVSDFLDGESSVRWNCHCCQRIFHCWVLNRISLSVRAWSTILSRCKTLYCASKSPFRRRKASPEKDGIWAPGRVVVTGMVDTFQQEQEDTCTLCWKLLCWRCWGELQLSWWRSWDDFLASFSLWFYFLHISFESKLLLEQTQI